MNRQSTRFGSETVSAVRETAVEHPAFSRAEIILTILGLMLGLFLAGLDQTIVAIALPNIARDLGGWEKMSWIVTAYLVSSTAATPIYGRLSDLYGRRPIVLFSLTVFIVASVLCALAWTLPELVAARALQGAGGGGLRSMALVVIADLVSPRERGRYQGYFAGTMTTANALGPILGGFLAQHLSWHWIFWINLPIGLAAGVLSSRQLARPPNPPRHVSVDWIGAALIIAAVTLLLIGIGNGDGSGKRPLLPMIVLVGSSIACTAALIWREGSVPQPMLPLHLFRNKIFLAGSAVISLMSALIVGLIIVIPLDYQLIVGLSPGATGLRMIPFTSGTAIGSLLAGQLVSRTGNYRPFPAIGAVAAAFACLSLAKVGLGASLLFDVTTTGLLGIAAGFQISPISVAVQNAVRREDAGIGMASLLLFRSLAGAFGVALFSALLIGAAAINAPVGLEQDLPRHFSLSQVTDGSGLLSGETLAFAKDALRSAFSKVFLVGAIIMVCSFCASLSLSERPLRRVP